MVRQPKTKPAIANQMCTRSRAVASGFPSPGQPSVQFTWLATMNAVAASAIVIQAGHGFDRMRRSDHADRSVPSASITKPALKSRSLARPAAPNSEM